MTLENFKMHIDSFPKGHTFNYSISDPFSWRGSYDEVAFRVERKPSTKEQIQEKIGRAYSDFFIGYKGGEFRYSDWTDIHFEESVGDYTEGKYCAEWIAKIENSLIYASQEERLVNLLFNV